MLTQEINQYNYIDIKDDKGKYLATIINGKVNHIKKNTDSNELRELADILDLINQSTTVNIEER